MPPRCAWCHSAFDSRAVRLRGRVVCASCGVATTDPWPSDAELDAAYGEWYRPAGGRFGGPGDAVLALTRGALARRIDAVAPAGPVLDVGSGDGTLVRALSRRGREAVGIERGDEEPPGEARFAAVVLWHVLEHLRDPLRVLRDACGRLVPGGRLVVAVPNTESLQARAFGDDWLALDLPRHLVHIPASALRLRLAALGLRVVRESHWRGGQIVFGWLHGLVGRVSGEDLYASIRRPEARHAPGSSRALVAGAALLPAALACSAAEVALHRGGSVYMEAVR